MGMGKGELLILRDELITKLTADFKEYLQEKNIGQNNLENEFDQGVSVAYGQVLASVSAFFQNKCSPVKDETLVFRSFPLWVEKYKVLAGKEVPELIGYANGHTFKEACDNLANLCDEFRKQYDSEKVNISWL
ncbi:hypothetical protein [Niallia taxi]|uniref:hypothetical protein n=1 Tax=Niallia taxi TaxID=2499688 RepID=UPI003D2E37D9